MKLRKRERERERERERGREGGREGGRSRKVRRRRLLKDRRSLIINLDQLGVPSSSISTGVAETNEVIIKKLMKSSKEGTQLGMYT